MPYFRDLIKLKNFRLVDTQAKYTQVWLQITQP